MDSTWAIFEARYPLERDEHLQEELRRKLFLLAESRGLTDLDQIQTSALQAISLE